MAAAITAAFAAMPQPHSYTHTHAYICIEDEEKKWNYDDQNIFYGLYAGQKRKRNYKFTGNAHTRIELGIVY